MDKFDRIYAVHNKLQASRYPVTRVTLEETLECSQSTVERIIANMRNYLNAPIEYDQGKNGYYYDTRSQYNDGQENESQENESQENYQLPGLWFNADELYALTVMQQLLSQLQTGLLDEQISPLKELIEKLLGDKKTGTEQLNARLKFINQTYRKNNLPAFQKITSAVIQQKQITIDYHARGTDEKTNRTISPQRLIYYRDNWYLDAWCHNKNGLRSFSLDRIKQPKIEKQPAKTIDDKTLDHHYTQGYGIFSGECVDTAIIKFTPERARWVADESWHPEQKGETLDDGSYLLHIPYSNPTELIMDILKYGPDAEVIEPTALREQMKARIAEMQKMYET